MLYSIHLFKKDLRRKLNKFVSRNNKACLEMNYSVMLSKQQFHFKMFPNIFAFFFSSAGNSLGVHFGDFKSNLFSCHALRISSAV